jgi:hypothetical protein
VPPGCPRGRPVVGPGTTALRARPIGPLVTATPPPPPPAAPPPSEPPLPPVRRPFGSVALPHAVAARPVPPRPRTAPPARWAQGRVVLPLLSVSALRAAPGDR